MKTLLVAVNAQFMHVALAVRQIRCRCGTDAGEVQIVEGNINLPFDAFLRRIGRENPDAVGFSVYIWNADYVWRLARSLRAALPGVVLFAGGPEIDKVPTSVLNLHPELDYLLSGEGEITVPALLNCLSRGERGEELFSLPGLCYRVNGAPRANPAPPPLPPESWPDVWKDGIEGLEKRILYIETSRGCPFRCGFCLSGGGERVRALNAEEAIRRLIFLAERGAKLIKLIDRTFNYDSKRAAKIWRALSAHSVRTGLLPRYHFEIAAQLLDEECLSAIREAPAGLFQFEAGIQSTDPGVLSCVGRSVPFSAIAPPLRAIASFGNCHLHVDLIAGLPRDTLKRFAKSFDDAFSLSPDALQLGFLKLLPGSDLQNRALALGIAYEPDPPYEVMRTRDMRFSDLCFLKDVERALNWFHESGRYRCALRLLLRDAAPFTLFSRIALTFRQAGVFDADRDEKYRATALLNAFPSPLLEALLRHDLLRARRRRDLPDALAFTETDAERAALRESYGTVRGQSAFCYDWDVLAFEAGGEPIQRKTLVFYDK